MHALTPLFRPPVFIKPSADCMVRTLTPSRGTFVADVSRVKVAMRAYGEEG